MLKKLCCIFMLVVLVACQQADINVEQGSYIYKGDDISFFTKCINNLLNM